MRKTSKILSKEDRRTLKTQLTQSIREQKADIRLMKTERRNTEKALATIDRSIAKAIKTLTEEEARLEALKPAPKPAAEALAA